LKVAYARKFAQYGVDLLAISELLARGDTQITPRIYAHDAVAKLPDFSHSPETYVASIR
jgi:hypothetical protein